MDAVQIRLGSESGGRVAVVFDGSDASLIAISRAIEVARNRRGRLTIIAVVPKSWMTAWMTAVGTCSGCPPISAARLAQEATERMEQTVQRLVATVPADVPCTTILRSGTRARACRTVLEECQHDILITTAPKRFLLTRAQSPLTAAVAA